ncbi:MAG: GGDEF domain-containing protein [Vicinamibacteria bacterium]|nr:GGDEF domain-containing protein [Vicinamibacteria bacterium]
MARNALEGGQDSWRAPLPPSEDDSVPVGTLLATFDQPLESAAIAVLHELTHTVTVAVRNVQTFERTRRLTFTDDLTALYNSRFMALYLDRELKRCRRTRASLSLLFMDLDGFKNVNDTHGHLAGSRTLVEVGVVLERTVRDADVLIRYGGDEFIILFPETPLAGGLVIAERIRQVISSTKFLESQNIEARVSASIGLAAYPETADDVRGLISSADRAMYRAKTLGKDRVVVASPLTAPLNSPKED